MAFNNVSHDVSPQQFSELWESSRCAPRQNPLREDHTGSFQGKKSLEESQENMDSQRSLQNQQDAAIIGSKTSKVGDAVETSPASHEERNLLEGDVGNSKLSARTWLSGGLLTHRDQELQETENDQVSKAAEKWCPTCSANSSESCMCGMTMHAGNSTTVLFPNQATYTHWLSMPDEQTQGPQRQAGVLNTNLDSEYYETHQTNRMATELNLSQAGFGRDSQHFSEMRQSAAGPSFAEDYVRSEQQSAWESARQPSSDWEHARNKALVAAHPLFPAMLEAHASCIRLGTPDDDLPYIEAQLSQAHDVTNRFRVLQLDQLDVTQEEKVELDHFMNGYTMYLASFKDTLEEHVGIEITDTMRWMWNMDQRLHSLTGKLTVLNRGETMSDEEENGSDYALCADPSLDPQDSGGFGPLAPITESERTLMERVRHELKYELKQGYRKKIVDVREEILRKRRAGKLPEGTTTVLKAWWQDHKKWPYPTEDDKEQLIQDTGLELKQINNWFINQRKRNWNGNPSSPSSSEFKNLKIKRKSWT